jgi:hypothetical protein
MVLAWNTVPFGAASYVQRDALCPSSEVHVSRAVATNRLARGSNDPDIVALSGTLGDVATFVLLAPGPAFGVVAMLQLESSPEYLAACEDANERCPTGCQSWVSTTLENFLANLLMTGTTSSPL